MINLNNPHLLFIEPSSAISKEPVIDDLTRKMATALKNGKVCENWMGVHTCACGANSTASNYNVENGLKTNSLAVHYLMWHRNEVPESELKKVGKFRCEGSDPEDDFNPNKYREDKQASSKLILKHTEQRAIARKRISSIAKIITRKN